jgi:hypothetical protein
MSGSLSSPQFVELFITKTYFGLRPLQPYWQPPILTSKIGLIESSTKKIVRQTGVRCCKSSTNCRLTGFDELGFDEMSFDELRLFLMIICMVLYYIYGTTFWYIVPRKIWQPWYFSKPNLGHLRGSLCRTNITYRGWSESTDGGASIALNVGRLSRTVILVSAQFSNQNSE